MYLLFDTEEMTNVIISTFVRSLDLKCVGTNHRCRGSWVQVGGSWDVFDVSYILKSYRIK